MAISVAVPTTAPAASPVPPKSDQPRGAPAAPPAHAAQGSDEHSVAAARTAKAAPTAIGFALHYDQDLRRMILEARDPISGFVIYQIPPKYAAKQFATAGSAEPHRGAQVDSAV